MEKTNNDSRSFLCQYNFLTFESVQQALDDDAIKVQVQRCEESFFCRNITSIPTNVNQLSQFIGATYGISRENFELSQKTMDLTFEWQAFIGSSWLHFNELSYLYLDIIQRCQSALQNAQRSEFESISRALPDISALVVKVHDVSGKMADQIQKLEDSLNQTLLAAAERINESLTGQIGRNGQECEFFFDRSLKLFYKAKLFLETERFVWLDFRNASKQFFGKDEIEVFVEFKFSKELVKSIEETSLLYLTLIKAIKAFKFAFSNIKVELFSYQEAREFIMELEEKLLVEEECERLWSN